MDKNVYDETLILYLFELYFLVCQYFVNGDFMYKRDFSIPFLYEKVSNSFDEFWENREENLKFLLNFFPRQLKDLSISELLSEYGDKAYIPVKEMFENLPKKNILKGGMLYLNGLYLSSKNIFIPFNESSLSSLHFIHLIEKIYIIKFVGKEFKVDKTVSLLELPEIKDFTNLKQQMSKYIKLCLLFNTEPVEVFPDLMTLCRLEENIYERIFFKCKKFFLQWKEYKKMSGIYKVIEKKRTVKKNRKNGQK